MITERRIVNDVALSLRIDEEDMRYLPRGINCPQHKIGKVAALVVLQIDADFSNVPHQIEFVSAVVARVSLEIRCQVFYEFLLARVQPVWGDFDFAVRPISCSDAYPWG